MYVHVCMNDFISRKEFLSIDQLPTVLYVEKRYHENDKTFECNHGKGKSSIPIYCDEAH